MTRNVGHRKPDTCLIVQAQNGTCKFEKHFAISRQTKLSAIAVEQGSANAVFKPFDLMGDGWLRTPDLFSG